jgi:hypothetical protein
MKKENSRYRANPAQPGLPGPVGDRHLNSFQPASANGPREVKAKKIYIIRQTRVLRTANGPSKKIRRILIFDNHPDSFRLVYAGRADSRVSDAESVSSSGVAVIWILVVGLMMAMFLPIF